MPEQEVILITGTRKGIGRQLVEYYIKKGFHVVGCSRQAPDYSFENYKHFCLDVSEETGVKKMFLEVEKIYNRLDILINNAGVSAMNYALFTPLSSARDTVNTNFLGTFVLCREAAKIMQKNKYGRIVNISSIAVALCSAGTAVYGASKAAIEQFSRVLAREIAPYNITVNTLALSFVKGGGMDEHINEKAIKEALNQTVYKSYLDFEDVAHAIDFFISRQSSCVTAQTLYLGGV